MSSIIENWAKVNGRIKSIDDHPTLKGYKQIQLALEKTGEVKDFPNLAKQDEGKTIRINLKAEQMESNKIKIKDPLNAIVRKAYGDVYFLK